MSAGSEVDIRWASAPADLPGALRVREQVFCAEQGVPLSQEHDGLDENASHLVAVDAEAGEVIGTLRLLMGAGVARIGRVAVERDWRRRGIASRMLALALERARERGCDRARLAAQLDATELYELAGFAVESEPFQEAGIAHVWMGRRLAGAERDG
ncbi:MAG: GNAT family N-acetyltransferase [Actinomycetota bacterium]|nr:GNAT family N-acetyltransferase [Actinomycetota bacterium]